MYFLSMYLVFFFIYTCILLIFPFSLCIIIIIFFATPFFTLSSLYILLKSLKYNIFSERTVLLLQYKMYVHDKLCALLSNIRVSVPKQLFESLVTGFVILATTHRSRHRLCLQRNAIRTSRRGIRAFKTRYFQTRGGSID